MTLSVISSNPKVTETVVLELDAGKKLVVKLKLDGDVILWTLGLDSKSWLGCGWAGEGGAGGDGVWDEAGGGADGWDGGGGADSDKTASLNLAMLGTCWKKNILLNGIWQVVEKNGRA